MIKINSKLISKIMKKVKKVAISACLAGYNCRYNAKPKGNFEVMQKLKEDDRFKA